MAMLQVPNDDWIISNRDRVRVLTSWHTLPPNEELSDKLTLLKLGLLKTLDPKNPRDQEIVLQEIALLDFIKIPIEDLLWTTTVLSPYFANYNFADDPVLTTRLWKSFRDVPATNSWWRRLDQLGIHLLVPVKDIQLSKSPAIRDYPPQYLEDDDGDRDRIPSDLHVSTKDTAWVLHYKNTEGYRLPPEQLGEFAKNFRQALSILFRQPYFLTDDGYESTLFILSPPMRRTLGFPGDFNIENPEDVELAVLNLIRTDPS